MWMPHIVKYAKIRQEYINVIEIRGRSDGVPCGQAATVAKLALISRAHAKVTTATVWAFYAFSVRQKRQYYFERGMKRDKCNNDMLMCVLLCFHVSNSKYEVMSKTDTEKKKPLI